MATSKAAARERSLDLRKIVLYVANNLSQDEKESLQFLYDVPDEYKATIKMTFDYLQKKQDCFSTTNPEGLLEIVSNLERSDLAQFVTDKLQAYHGSKSEQATKPLKHQPLVQNLELKRHLESTLKLCPLYPQHIKALKACLVDIAREDPDHPNVDTIKRVLKEAEDHFKTGNDLVLARQWGSNHLERALANLYPVRHKHHQTAMRSRKVSNTGRATITILHYR